MNKAGLVISGILVMIVLLFSMAAVLGAKPAPLTAKFDDSNFVAPDYDNGASANLNVGSAKTFNYNCHCATQKDNPVCSGNIRLQIDSGSGFVNEKSDACNVAAGATCSANYVKTFSVTGIYKFRVFCDENTGIDYTQPSNEYVTLTVQGCTNGATSPCPLQQGVCEGSVQTCSDNQWGNCDYGVNYGEESAFGCDSLDNDCNGVVDEIDLDHDGFSSCGGIGSVNEVWIEGGQNDWSNINVYSFNPTTGVYDSIWSVTDPVDDIIYGGAIGDITHDGQNDIVVPRYTGGNGGTDVWTYSKQTGTFNKVWSGTPVVMMSFNGIGNIMDFDNDGYTEFLFNFAAINGYVQVWGNDSDGGGAGVTSFSPEATIATGLFEMVAAQGCDLNNNGIPEIITRSWSTTSARPYVIYEWNGANYQWKQNITLSEAGGQTDMSCGDVDRDGVAELVVCSGQKSRVIKYTGGSYQIIYESPSSSGITAVTNCNVVDMTNDGWSDWADVNSEVVRVFSFNPTTNSFYSVWNSSALGGSIAPFIGSADGADSDNDGKAEYIYGPTDVTGPARIWESNAANANTFFNTYNFPNQDSFTNILIGDINPYNDGGVDCDDNNNAIHPGAIEICGNGIDEDCDGSDLACPACIDNDSDGYGDYCASGLDCNDNNAAINPGATEVCGDSIDNNCNNQIDEGCVVNPFCGDGYCDGSAYSENCNTCSLDCWSGSKGACCGDGKCDTRKGETALLCPVDC